MCIILETNILSLKNSKHVTVKKFRIKEKYIFHSCGLPKYWENKDELGYITRKTWNFIWIQGKWDIRLRTYLFVRQAVGGGPKGLDHVLYWKIDFIFISRQI